MDQTAESHQPITIAAQDWHAIQETLYLLSVPGMRESIKEGMDQAPDTCAKGA